MRPLLAWLAASALAASRSELLGDSPICVAAFALRGKGELRTSFEAEDVEYEEQHDGAVSAEDALGSLGGSDDGGSQWGARRRRQGPPAAPGCGGACDGVCFGTWNIQNLGVSKAKRPAVMAAIHSVLARYDIASIQELSQMPRAPFECGLYTESVICDARPDAEAYSVVASPRIGDEQYAVLLRSGVARASGEGATFPDPGNVHSRPPHAFDIIVEKGEKDWRLLLASTHTSPRAATQEIANFPEVLHWMRTTLQNGSKTTVHELLAGDFNADGTYFKASSKWPGSHLDASFDGYALLTGNDMDSTVAKGDNAYDRIIVDDALSAKSGAAKVFRLEDLDLTAVRSEGCKMGYVPDKWCTSAFDGVSWSHFPDDAKAAMAAELSDHHPVEVCLRG